MQIVRPRQISPEQDHDRAVQWARNALANPLTVILDTETTDFKGYVCEIAFINRLGETLYSAVVDPRVPITPGATSVHGITNDEASGQPDFGYVWQNIRWITDANVIAWNAPFDWAVINREMDRLNFARLRNNWQCAMREYGAWKGEINPQYGDYKWHKLEGGHRALGDCVAAWNRIREMAIG